MVIILKLYLISHFMIKLVIAPLPMVFTFHNLFVLQEYVQMIVLLNAELLKQGYQNHKI